MSRLQLLARAEAITGRDLGYLRTFKAYYALKQEAYSKSRRRWSDENVDNSKRV